ncbi:MAG: DNA-binding response regulator, partial [Oscillospiraceae bacterium]
MKHHLFINTAKSMQDAIESLKKTNYLIVIIEADNLEYLPYQKLIREMKPMPILVVSSKYDAAEKLEAIRLGADEYLVRPCTVEESITSGLALIRRYTLLN